MRAHEPPNMGKRGRSLMLHRWTRPGYALRRVALVFTAAVLILALAHDPAEARRKHHKARSGGGYSPPYAAIVVDANSGKVLHSANPDATRHPASLTKIMTLYMLFEQLEAGKLKLSSELEVSSHAASQAPSKLGVRPGRTIEVEDAILALVTKSANDVAVVIAEAIAGDEDDFAKLMTRKARQLGMASTIYRNASGLPNPQQITTARDQATLGRAIQDRFPKLYKYFAARTFNYHGRSIGNHNRLLGRIPGVDGIKTGYVRASGFNLVASMRRSDRHVVAVVLGGSSGRSRDARMAQLLEGHVMQASVRRTAPKLIETADAQTETQADDSAETEVAETPKPAKTRPVPVTVASATPIVPSAEEPIKPIVVRTMSVKRAGAPLPVATPAGNPGNAIDTVSYRTASTSLPTLPAPAYAAAPTQIYAPPAIPAVTSPSSKAGTLGTLPARQAAIETFDLENDPPPAQSRSIAAASRTGSPA
ncbi:MAG: D-alanyl-D-alanine carboxypeptidase, partial [Variibacter sp.]|nr:D-alanyl-D-alanine carboxypeptidase [Variibacter sp.]